MFCRTCLNLYNLLLHVFLGQFYCTLIVIENLLGMNSIATERMLIYVLK